MYSRQEFRPKKKVKLTYHIRGDASAEKHIGAVAALQLDEITGRLYTAGRDSTVREWDVGPAVESPGFIAAYEGHTDWVNDVSVCRIGEAVRLASVSSDRSVRLWEPGGDGKQPEVILRHLDYVKATAFAEDTGMLLTAGLDGKVWTWDLGALPIEEVGAACEHPQSIYCVDVNRRGTIAALGSVDKVVRLWDPRTNTPFGVLKGHHDMVKAVAVSADGSKCLSGGSDNMLKLWDVGERRCIGTFRPHADSIWCIQADPDFTRVYSGSRDGSVVVTQLTRDESEAAGGPASHQLLETGSSVLALAASSSGDRLWTSSILGGVQEHVLSSANAAVAPGRVVEVDPPLTKFKLFTDGQTVCTEDATGRSKLWDLPTGTVTADLGEVALDDAVKAHDTQPCHVPKWCALDTALGFLSVHLEPGNAFTGWVNASAVGGRDAEETPVNLGALVLRVLLRRFQESKKLRSGGGRGETAGALGASAAAAAAAATTTMTGEPAVGSAAATEAHKSLVEAGLSHDLFTLPDHTRMVLSQTTEPVRTICQMTVGSCGDQTETLLRECPEWIQQALFNRLAPFGDKSKPPEIAVFVGARSDKDANSSKRFGGLRKSAQPVRYVGKPTTTVRSLKVAIAKSIKDGGADPAEISVFHEETELADEVKVSYIYQTLFKRKEILLEYTRTSNK